MFIFQKEKDFRLYYCRSEQFSDDEIQLFYYVSISFQIIENLFNFFLWYWRIYITLNSLLRYHTLVNGWDDKLARKKYFEFTFGDVILIFLKVILY